MTRCSYLAILLCCWPLPLLGWGFRNEGESILDPSLNQPLRVPAKRVSEYTPNVPVLDEVHQIHRNEPTSSQRSSSSSSPSSSRVSSSNPGGVAPPPVENSGVKSAQSNSDDVMEVQHATCEINTDELVATAQATATRVLKGLCNPRDIEDRFHNLEVQLAEQFNVIKTMILNMEDKLGDHEQQMRRQHRRMIGTILRNGGECSNRGTSTINDLDENEAAEKILSEIREESSPRDAEIMRLNSTIRMENGHKVFTYYWTIRDMEYKLTGWNHRRSLRSPSFYISPGGYRMYIRAFPRQNGENVYIHVGITKGDFDESLEWPFKLKHKVNVLDHSKNPQDISSRLWDPAVLCSGWNWRRPVSGDNYECVGLGFGHDVVRSREYINNDSIVIKLSVYLD